MSNKNPKNSLLSVKSLPAVLVRWSLTAFDSQVERPTNLVVYNGVIVFVSRIIVNFRIDFRNQRISIAIEGSYFEINNQVSSDTFAPI